jgi:hypothetical protein
MDPTVLSVSLPDHDGFERKVGDLVAGHAFTVIAFYLTEI